jgi:gliding motility-associated-like protein
VSLFLKLLYKLQYTANRSNIACFNDCQMRLTISALITVSLLSVCPNLYSQNYIENPSFETIASCPNDFFQIYKSPPWFSPTCNIRSDLHNNAILFTGKCNDSITGIPRNALCTQGAHGGVAYAGIEVVSYFDVSSSYRQHLETKLKQPLEKGKRYLFSMFYNLCRQRPDRDLCFKTDNLGAYFSTNMVDDNPQCSILPHTPQAKGSAKKVRQSENWEEMSDCFTATDNAQYVTIGNFADNASSDCTVNNQYIQYIIFIDDVSLIGEIHKNFDTVLCSGNSWTVNAKDFRQEYTNLSGWQYQWSDGQTGFERTFEKPGNYTLKIMMKDGFTDEYQFNIVAEQCDCISYIPNSFTPDGNRLNDTFIPHLVCNNYQASEYSFSIFNRWGVKVFSTVSTTEAWDGTYKGQKVPGGTYLYFLRYKSAGTGKISTAKGSVMVIR